MEWKIHGIPYGKKFFHMERIFSIWKENFLYGKKILENFFHMERKFSKNLYKFININ